MAGLDFGIIIPAFNEEKTIADVVRKVSLVGLPIVVDDGSSDSTESIAVRHGAVVVKHAKNLGYDSALNSGFNKADKLGFKFAVTIDADGQHNPSALSEIAKILIGGADVVCGVRDKRQRVGEHIFAFFGKVLWGISDPLCGLKGYNLEIYRDRGHFDSYGSVGTELIIFAARNKKNIVQLPIKTFQRLDAPRFGTSIRANFKIMRSLIMALIKKDIPL
jgi:glycosyltransferase involved in cell wall biosynthesis